MKVKMLCNLGTLDQAKYDIPDGSQKGLPPRDGDVISVNEKQAHALVDLLRCAVSADSANTRIVEQSQDVSDESVEVESPVVEETAQDAIDRISRMRSAEKLQEIIDTDQRITVTEAAERRLAEL